MKYKKHSEIIPLEKLIKLINHNSSNKEHQNYQWVRNNLIILLMVLWVNNQLIQNREEHSVLICLEINL